MISDKALKSILHKVEIQGFIDLGIMKNFDLLSFAQRIGKPTPILPNEPELGLVGGRVKANNLSIKEYASIYKKNIPFHTDAAYYELPPKYLILKLKQTSQSNRTTTIKKIFTAIDQYSFNIFNKSLWKIRTPQGGFFIGKIIEKVNDNYFFRYDQNSMKPYFKKNIQSKYLLNNIINNLPLYQIHWEPEQVVIINNWKVFHGNSEIINNIPSQHRILERVLVTI